MQGNVFSLKSLNNKGKDIFLRVEQRDYTVSSTESNDNILSNLVTWKEVPKSNDENSTSDYKLDESSLFCAVPLDPHLKMEVDLVRSIEKFLKLYIDNQQEQESLQEQESNSDTPYESEVKQKRKSCYKLIKLMVDYITNKLVQTFRPDFEVGCLVPYR